MMRRGYKQCRSCTADVPIASRNCSACGQDQRKQGRSSSADSALSPVHQTRITFRNTVHIRSPEATRQRAPTRRQTGHSSRQTAAEAVTHLEETYSDGDCQEDGGFWHDDAAEEAGFAGPSEPVSPVSRGVLRFQGESPVQQYIRVLRLSPHRWVLIGESPSGAACYAMAGYDRSRDGGISIMAARSVHVIAMPLLYLDGERHYCYVCDCKDMRPGLNILRGMCSSATTKTAWDRAAKPCLHSQAAEVLHGQSERSAIYSMPEEALQRGLTADMELDTDSVYVVNPSHGQDFLLSVASEEGSTSRVFVGATSRCKLRCQHCCGVQQWIDDEDGRTVELCDIFDSFSLHSQGDMDENTAQRSMPISTLKIPDNYISELLGIRGLGLGSFFPQASASRIDSATVHLVPESGGHCHICSAPWACQDPVKAGWLKTTGTLYGMSGCAAASVYYRPCSQEGCTAVQHYDGLHDSIFDFSNASLFTYELCFNYTDSMLLMRLPFASHWQQLLANYRRSGQAQRLCARGTHRKALLAFIRLLDTDYEHGFSCPVCSTLEHSQLAVIIDGKEMGMNRALSKPYVAPKAPDDSASVPVECGHQRTVCIPHQRTRLLLNRWAGATDKKGKTLSELTEEEFEELTILAETKLPGLRAALDHAVSMDEQGTMPWARCPQQYRPLFKSIAKNYPASGMISPVYAAEQLGRLLHGQNRMIGVDRKQALAAGFPALHEVASECHWSVVPSALLPILRSLRTKARIPLQCAETVDCELLDSAAEQDHVFMPSHPLCRGLPPFAADLDKGGDEERCNKFHRKHNMLTPGIFTLFCGHGVCLGFKLMANKEGPAMAFDLLYTRFRQAPAMVVYDNACNLHRYALRRAPKLFAKTAFRIDRLHIFSHNGCSSGYNISKYPQDSIVVPAVSLDRLNTQIAEQTNSVLERIRTQVAYMLHDNALAYTKFFLAKNNAKTIAALD